jgi:AAA family ATP:ADP antiporter
MSFFKVLKESSSEFKKDLSFFLVSYFLVLFNYPLVRASTTALFFESHGAKSSPGAWIVALGLLTISIFILNQFQKRYSVQYLFAGASLFSGLVFLSGSFGIGARAFSYLGFIWKEVYIVIQVHLLLAYANNYFPKEHFKKLLGPVGAVGSLGGIAGGLMTSHLSGNGGTSLVLALGLACVMLPGALFYFTGHFTHQRQEHESPLASLKTPELRRYVALIAGLVIMTQFIINIADFRFNLSLEQMLTSSDARTGYLGHIYTWTNALTFGFQFLLLPFLLPRIKERSLHLFLPISFALGTLVLVTSPALSAISLVYVYFKGADYSLFSAAKELLYHPLAPDQKYGAKYLTDMLVYRGAKALIALMLIYLQTSSILNMLMMIFLGIWMTMVIKLFQLHAKLFS